MSNEKNLDYLFVLKALDEIPFGVGRKLLIDFLQGKENNDSIIRNNLFDLENFGCLAYDKDEINDMIDNLLLNDLIKLTSVKGNKFWKVMELSPKGIEEITNPSLYKKKLSFNFKESKTEITEEDKKMFEALKDFLSDYNDEQKKSIISNKNHVLCIAGAGSGKTAVLTKRIEFLVKYRSINPEKVLAITFTRKARQEMIHRLSKVSGLNEVNIETFNSFCEKTLRKNNDFIYDKTVKVLTYGDKIRIIKEALSKQDMDFSKAIDAYFTYAQIRGKTQEQLANIFLNDCFFVRDYFKFKNRPIIKESFEMVDTEHEKNAKLVLSVCNYIETYMIKYGYRDFADQLIDTLNMFQKNKDLIPKFDHILIDEYQDVNSTQIKLVDLLNSENLFCVGDPRQSIFGWRGSDIKYILNFSEKFPDCEIITLTKNYRSTKQIVDLINCSIKNLGLADLEPPAEGKKDVKLLKFDSEIAEFEFLIQCISQTKLPRNEIFVLARTNRQLNDLSKIMKQRRIKHVVRSDEIRKSVIAGIEDVTLATIHAIKGLEAKMVFVIGCNGINFPCKGSEHPVIEMVKVDEYDKEEEERRLFYVAMSRAKESLYLTYSGRKPTNFINNDMYDIIEDNKINIKLKENSRFSVVKSNNIVTRLKEWRKDISQKSNVPAYIILHDKTLINIAVQMPLEQSDLEKINGLGPAKIMKYGEEILDIING